jgi:hypothetical protein
MILFRYFRGKNDSGAPINFRSAEWVDRFYFLSAYFTGLCALLLIGYSILGDKTITPQTRERRGWDLSQPDHIDPRTIGR